MALLVVIDDGSTNGMVIRLLREETTLGREEADVNIPHDGQVSRNHASILRVSSDGRFRWYLRDNQSSNGTFIRVARTKLKADQEFLIGSKRFRYHQSSGENPGDERDAGNSTATRMWTAISKQDLESSLPRLVEQRAGSDDGQSILLNRDQVIIGNEAGLDTRIDDPYLDLRHARISTSHDGRWIIEDLNSLNGVWIKVNRVELTAKCEFRIGEQRLLFQPPV
jgi:pSer/pThr/pTyr-binding forkhead associated (FHA) protein